MKYPIKSLLVLAPHPIFYQTPIWRRLNRIENLETFVVFEKDVEKKIDKEFGTIIDWGELSNLDGYSYSFIGNPIKFFKLFRKKFDFLLINSWNSPWVWIAAIAAKIYGTKILLRAENPWKQELIIPRYKFVIKKIVLGLFFGLVDKFLFIGKGNKDLYLNYGIPEKKLFFTPYSVENERFFEVNKSLPDKYLLRNQLGIPENALIFLTVGKLIQKKRPLDLLEAFKKVNFENKFLIYVGEGDQRKKIEANLPENVLLAGFKNQFEIAKYYAMADVFILPSEKGETWGLVVNEAMCFRLPIIVSDMVGSSEDLIIPGENGEIFPLGNIEELAGIMESFQDLEKRKVYGEKSLEIVKKYNFNNVVKGILEAINYSAS